MRQKNSDTAMKPRKSTILFGSIALAIVCLSGCARSATCEVTQYAPKYLSYHGSSEPFDDACREVLHRLSQKQSIEGKGAYYPYYGEGASSHKAAGRQTASERYLKTQDEDGAQHKITTLCLGKHDPIVILESTASDPYKLVNALNSELNKRGIKVSQY
jgi:hypothetical protein